MKKLRLNLDELSVRSFATNPDGPTQRGTVDARVQVNNTFVDSQICTFDLTNVSKDCNPEPVQTSGWNETYGSDLDP